MFRFNSLFGFDARQTLERSINPASGLPMVEGTEIDVRGNIYGTDCNSDGFTAFIGFGSGLDFGGGCGFDD